MKVIAINLRLVTLLTVGWCLQAQAQPTGFSLPPLPGVPGSGNVASGSAAPIPTLPTLPNLGAQGSPPLGESITAPPLPDAIPELSALPTPKDSAAVAAANAEKEAPPAPVNDAASADPITPVSTLGGTESPAAPNAAATGGAATLDVAAPPATLPGLDFSAPPTLGLPPAIAPQTVTALPEVGVDAPPAPRPAARTWKTTLAPAIIPKTTTFNYRRQILPDTIYRASYDPGNRHLPVAISRDGYTQLLIDRVAANDVDATRALLNRGLPVNTTDAAGQPLIAIARRYGAGDTERLLIARGAS